MLTPSPLMPTPICPLLVAEELAYQGEAEPCREESRWLCPRSQKIPDAGHGFIWEQAAAE